jgi:hypothetical protein
MFCSAHRQAGNVDVITRRCGAESCSARASYAPPGAPPQYCAQHRALNHVDVRHKPRAVATPGTAAPHSAASGQVVSARCKDREPVAT